MRPRCKQIRSRDASAPELCQRHSQIRPAEQDRVTPRPAVGPAFGSIMPNKQKGSGTPAGALVQTSAPYGRGSREASRARLTAFHHGACCSDRTPQLNSSTRFLGLGVIRCYLHLTCPSPAGCPADRSSCRTGV
jgi:hypothetical protein